METGACTGGRELCGDQTSEITPLTALKLAELAKDIFPAGVLNVLFGRGKTVGDPLTGHEKVRMVSLTGSIATGEHIIGHTASSIKRTHMELGGKAPVIVFDDADLDAVVEGVRTFGFTMPGRTALPPAASMLRREFTPRWWENSVPQLPP
jgi:aminobutyraldehyde dehydrogenase